LIGFVGLNPNLAVLDAEVKSVFLHAMIVIPTEIHQDIILGLVIEYSLDFHAIVARPANICFPIDQRMFD